MSTILVTGASGYLASWIVDGLLRGWHTVHATMRDIGHPDKTLFLRKLSEWKPGTLHLFEADLLTEWSFAEAMIWCDIVIHTASPYFLTKSQDPENELIRPALEWTINILTSVNQTPSMKRVVLTSSIVALYNNAKDIWGDHIIREDSLNTNTDIHYNSYAYSKTLAESMAWEMQKSQKHWDLITIHPGAIFGPSLSNRVDATSVGMMRDFLSGSFRTGVPELYLGVVDVRDVATAHMQAAIIPEAKGKYIIVSETMTLLEIGQSIDLSEFNILDKLPKKQLPKWFIWAIAPFIGMSREYVSTNVGYPISYDTDRSKSDLNLVYRTPRETLHDHIDQLVRDSLV
jgi:nucleoside-diphosphate-sugar epimerase